MKYFLVLFSSITYVLSASDNLIPRIVIVGAGPAGIAAASRLLENGFTDVTILEAEDRVGGRVYSIEFGDYMVDLGGQWVHGQKDNVAFELAWPLGLLEKFDDNHNLTMKFFGSSGSSLSYETSFDLFQFYIGMVENISDIENLKTGSFGEYADAKIAEYFEAHPEIDTDLQKPLLYTLNLAQLAADGANSWYDVSARGIRDYASCDGDQAINWKNRTYSTILDILMKKYPELEKELPVVNNTHTNTKVTKIDYNEHSAPIKISSVNGKEYVADHVIFTASLGVLKANHQELFDPPLLDNKINAIENIGFGHEAKILLFYEEPWWASDGDYYISKCVYWTDADRKEIENDPEKNWMLGIFNAYPVENKPKLLLLWVSSDLSTQMELIPEDIFRNQTLEFIQRFYGHEHNITEPTYMIRTSWNTNENFYGTYSYRGIKSDEANVTYADLAEPIMRDDKPILMFAGEATSVHYSTVHGAIESGWREADRLINLYSHHP